MKKLLSIVLTLCMVLTLLPSFAMAALSGVYVGGVKMADGNYLANNATEVRTAKPSSGGYAYLSGNTLTLNNYTYSGVGIDTGFAGNASIAATAYLTIVLEGKNTVTTTAASSYGVWCQDGLTISGGGSLDVKGKSGGIFCTKNLNISGGTITATGTADNADSASVSAGIYCTGDLINITGGNVTAVGGTATNNDGTARSCGIYGEKSLTVSGNAIVSAAGGASTGSNNEANAYSSGIYLDAAGAEFSAIDNAKVTATGSTSDSNSYGIRCKSSFLVNGNAQVSAIGGGATGKSSYGIYSDLNGVDIRNGKVVATGGSATGSLGTSCGICTDNSASTVTISGGKVVATGGEASSTSGSSSGINSTGTVTISDTAQVTAGGKAAFSSCGIFGDTITVSGGEMVTTGGEANGSYGVFSDTTTISGGKVVATGGKASDSNGIFSSDTVTISGGKVVATGGEASGTNSISYGIVANTAVTLSGGVTVARAGIKGTSYTGDRRYGVYCSTQDGITFKASGDGADTTKIAGAVGYNDTTQTLLTTTAKQTVTVNTNETAIGGTYGDTPTDAPATGVVIVPSGWTVANETLAYATISIGDNIAYVTAATKAIDEGEAGELTEASLTINERKTLVAVSLYEGNESSFGIYQTLPLNIENRGDLLAVGGMAETGGISESYGIKDENGYITIQGSGSTMAVGSSADNSRGIFVGDANLTLKGRDLFAVGNQYGLSGGNSGKTIELSGSNVFAVGGTDGIHSGHNITHSSGDVFAVGGSTGSGMLLDSHGGETIAISGGSGTAVSGRSAMNKAPASANGIALLDGAKYDDKIASWGPSKLTVKIGDAVSGYTSFERGWNAAVAAASAATVTLYENWTAAGNGKTGTAFTTSFGAGDGFGASYSESNFGCIVVPYGKNITLDLNGKTIDRGLGGSESGSKCGYLINVQGSLTLDDSSSTDVTKQGKLTGGNNSDKSDSVGAIYVYDGTFNMKGGNISGNKTANWASAVRVIKTTNTASGSFTMSGGKISDNKLYGDNTDTNGGTNGAVSLIHDGTSFTMTGGEISGNIGGGVGYYTTATTTLGGVAKITGNTNADDKPCNVYLTQATNNKITCYTITQLAKGAAIGISHDIVPTVANPVDITATAPSADYSAYFTSDSDNCVVGKKAGNDYTLQLKLLESAVTFGEHTNGGAFTASYKVSDEPLNITSGSANVPSGSTVTVTPGAANSGYVLDKVTVAKTGETSKTVTVTDNTFTMPAFPVTITVTYKSTGSAGGTGGGTTTVPTITVPVSSGADTVRLPATVSNGAAAITATDSQLKVIAADAKKTGSVSVDVSTLTNVGAVKLPSALINAVSGSGENVSMDVSLPKGTVSMDSAALADFSLKAGSGSGQISIRDIAKTVDSRDARALQNSAVYSLNISLAANGTEIHSLSGKTSVALKLSKTQNYAKANIYTLGTGGDLEPVMTYLNGDVIAFYPPHYSPFYVVNTPFDDVSNSAYYFSAMLWAAKNGVTNGVTATTFEPDSVCTRAQAVTFLWRAMGSPEPTRTNNPFTDVKSDAYYYKAVLWAVEKGITKGTSATTFDPDATVSRAQSVTFQWRAAGSPTVNYAMDFSDVTADSYYAEAVRWAVSEKITQGTGAKTFSPESGCTRAHDVTFLYRQLG